LGTADGVQVALLDQGHLLAHASGLRHAGRGVTKGVRHILVLFLNVDRGGADRVKKGGDERGEDERADPSGELGRQSDLCHARRCKRRGVDAARRRWLSESTASVETSVESAGGDGGGGGGGGVGESPEVAGDPRGCLTEALEEYRCGLHFNPWDHDLWHNAGMALWGLGQAHDAAAAFEQAFDLYPRDARVGSNEREKRAFERRF
jgi:hypothetical protein